MTKTPKENQIPCPRCQTLCEFSKKNPHSPFCSKACKDRDFIDWTTEAYKIAGEETKEKDSED